MDAGPFPHVNPNLKRALQFFGQWLSSSTHYPACEQIEKFNTLCLGIYRYNPRAHNHPVTQTAHTWPGRPGRVGQDVRICSRSPAWHERLCRARVDVCTGPGHTAWLASQAAAVLITTSLCSQRAWQVKPRHWLQHFLMTRLFAPYVQLPQQINFACRRPTYQICYLF